MILKHVTTSDYLSLLLQDKIYHNNLKVLGVSIELDFIGYRFQQCHFKECNFSDSFVRNGVFHNCEIVECNFNDSFYKNTKFMNCSFYDCSFDSTKFKSCNFRTSLMDNCSFDESLFYKCLIRGMKKINSTISAKQLKDSDVERHAKRIVRGRMEQSHKKVLLDMPFWEKLVDLAASRKIKPLAMVKNMLQEKYIEYQI